jgi:hypothetical protein
MNPLLEGQGIRKRSKTVTAGSFIVMHVVHDMGRNFVGYDISRNGTGSPSGVISIVLDLIIGLSGELAMMRSATVNATWPW